MNFALCRLAGVIQPPHILFMSNGKRTGITANPAVRMALVVLGVFLIAITPLVGPIPGPGGVIVFAAGLTLVLRYSDWAKKQYVKFKRKHPKKGAWADWGLRRQSHRRREALRKAQEEEGGEPGDSRAHVDARDVVEASRQGLAD
jgi:hypothetical protein